MHHLAAQGGKIVAVADHLGAVSKDTGLDVPALVEWTAEHRVTGKPSAAGIDLDGGWACVGYADQLAFVQIGAKEADWTPSPQPGLYRSIAVCRRRSACSP